MYGRTLVPSGGYTSPKETLVASLVRIGLCVFGCVALWLLTWSPSLLTPTQSCKMLYLVVVASVSCVSSPEKLWCEMHE